MRREIGVNPWVQLPFALRRRLPWVLLALALLHGFGFSWLKWGDLAVDTGRDLDAALRLSQGEMLYRDVRYYYGPFAPYFNALLFTLFGAHVDVFIAAGVVITILTTGVMYRLAREFLNRPASLLLTLAFIYQAAFAHLTPNSIFNFVLPYASAATQGFLAAAASLLLLLRYAACGKRILFAGACACLAIAVLCKLELAVAALAAHGLFWVHTLWTDRARLGFVSAGYGLALLAAGAGYGYFAAQIGTQTLLNEHLLSLLHSMRSISAEWMGTADAALHLGILAKTSAVYGVALGLAWLCAKTVRSGAAQAGAGVALALLTLPLLSLETAYRPLLPVCCAYWLHAVWQWVRVPEERGRALGHVLLATLGLALLGRMLLRPVTYHYGFFLLPIGLLGAAVFLFQCLPRGSVSRRANRALPLCVATLLLLSIAAHIRHSAALYALHTVDAGGPRGRLRILNHRPPVADGGVYYSALLRMLSECPAQTPVLVVQQGVGLTFLSGMKNPYPDLAYSSPEMTGAYSDAALLRRLQDHPPTLVVRTPTDDAKNIFGSTYAQQSWAWVQQNCNHFVSIGPKNYISVFILKSADRAPFESALKKAQGRP